MNPQRYNRQILLPQIGPDGQQRIAACRAVVLGCGALGTVIANLLARAGVGHLLIIDRDLVEESNLQRQVLFDEDDCRLALPKAVAAARKLRQINSQITIQDEVCDITCGNIERFVKAAAVVVDGTDNFETRFLLNDACVKHGVPWIYGAAVGTTGMSLTILPGRTPCLRCVFESAPPAGISPTCDTAGVLGSVTSLIGSYQSAEALKICAGRTDQVNTTLFSIDLWSGQTHHLKVAAAREKAECPTCKHHKFDYLEGAAASKTTSLCGRNAVQIAPPAGRMDLASLAQRLQPAAGVSALLSNEYLVRFQAPGGDDGQGLEITVFADGRSIVKGTRQPASARAAYAKFVGS